ncbi:hypothetical protein C8J57DRAFT_1290140 [Mycena rebaudengoi]|nr:hypothetical protein C8J57DRAFT_1290140 [Mycena rebaudengoi]
MSASVTPLRIGAASALPVSAARASSSRRVDLGTSPVSTAGVTGINFPSPVEPSPTEPRPPARPRPLRRMSRIDSTSSASQRHIIEIPSTTPPQVEDVAVLEDLWSALRLQKELKMDKERPKVKSLEEYKPSTSMNAILEPPPSPRPSSRLKISAESRPPVGNSSSLTPPSARARTPERCSLLDDVLGQERDSFFKSPSPVPPPTPPATLKKKKSVTSFRTSPDGRMVAIFNMQGIDKDDIRVTFRRDHIMVSWEKWSIEDWEEEDCIARRTVERVYHRVIPLAEGTKFRDIYGTMSGELLLLRYPPVGFIAPSSREASV